MIKYLIFKDKDGEVISSAIKEYEPDNKVFIVAPEASEVIYVSEEEYRLLTNT